MNPAKHNYEEGEEKYTKGISQVVWEKIVSDTETPVSSMMKLSDSFKNSLLLESVEGGSVKGRYSVIGLEPDLIWKAEGNTAYIKDNEQDSGSYIKQDNGTFESLSNLVNDSKIDLPNELPPMSAGIFGYIGYDAIRLIENIKDSLPEQNEFPDAMFMRPSAMVVFDNIKDEITIIIPIRFKKNIDYIDAVMESKKKILEIIDKINSDQKKQVKIKTNQKETSITSNVEKEEYISIVKKAKDYIKDGDIFQVVLSQKFKSPFKLHSFSLYRSLRRINPSPFLFFLNFEDFSVVGSSPEILIKLSDDDITLRPIAGTRPRGNTEEEDKENSNSLLNDPKELAEHLMLLDLGRNDIGKVSKIGSIKVTDKFFIEYYSHVMHIVSNIVGKIKEKLTAIDVLKSGFPAGTVSGAPKIRAMQIIEELEKERRSIYAGCVGYFSANGNMDTCIILRTAIIKDDQMYVQAGAGIVADSNPQSEYNECIAKAKALFNAADDALSINTKLK
ncbi:MAG: anthranilate synthase component I [Alphaproteobacteria bacterium]|jgi:anthranilate synthase component 1|nr:anthranilate synthase component I [Hyphomicrobiales bacterium]|tara:strand:- start:18638 stop:20143 length:1506 start_codon:yes stop_codon:yes gene_type:complete